MLITSFALNGRTFLRFSPSCSSSFFFAQVKWNKRLIRNQTQNRMEGAERNNRFSTFIVHSIEWNDLLKKPEEEEEKKRRESKHRMMGIRKGLCHVVWSYSTQYLIVKVYNFTSHILISSVPPSYFLENVNISTTRALSFNSIWTSLYGSSFAVFWT